MLHHNKIILIQTLQYLINNRISTSRSKKILTPIPILYNMLQTSIRILQYINIAITSIFLIAYIYRLFRLRHFAITDQHKSKFPCARVILCTAYAILSLPFLAVSIYYGITYSNTDDTQFWLIQFGVGQFVDAIILMMQLIVLRQQLNKQRPYTPFHLLFSIYLTLVSIARLIFVLIHINQQNSLIFVFLAFYLSFLINSVLLLGYWIAKRQQLPQFQNHNYFNFDQINNLNNTRNIMNRNIQISQLRKTSQNFNYIHPTVTVQKNQFRIILQISQLNTDLQDKLMLQQTQSRSTRKIGYHRGKKLKIISNQFYTINQILEMYKICGRFNIKQKLQFDNYNNLGDMYKKLQNYLDQLFSNKKNYLKFVLKFFSIQDTYIEVFEKSLRETFKDSQLDIYANMDRNAALVSINIFKQLWMDDYYLFYMDIVAADGKFQTRPMKRYNDFQMFYNQLTNIIKKKYGGKYILPNLPKKYMFNWDQSKITQRRNQLQSFLRSLANDYKLMLEMNQIRQATLQFLGVYQIKTIQPVSQSFQNFYKNIEIFKGTINKQLTNSQYVTFYQFKVFFNGIPIRTFKRRFNDFVILHQTIQRWMTNTQINYKFLVLPQKHLYKSGTDRHEKLKVYLESLIKIQDIWKVYQVNAFMKVGNNSMKDISMSRIHSPDEDEFDKNRKIGIGASISDQHDLQTQRFIDEDSFQSKGRMSALIEELGNN